MKLYLTEEQLKTNLSLGKSIEQWLGYLQKEEYTLLKWLRIDKERDGNYSVAYFESFDEGNKAFLDIYEFSLIDPDEPYGVINSFSTMAEALDFTEVTYGALMDKFVSAGMIQEEYLAYLNK